MSERCPVAIVAGPCILPAGHDGPHERKFAPLPPLAPEPSTGFTAGVITVTWTQEPPFAVTGREGRMYTANVEISVRHGIERDVGTKALMGLVVRAPDGSLARVAGVESFASHALIGPVGLLLVAMEER